MYMHALNRSRRRADGRPARAPVGRSPAAQSSPCCHPCCARLAVAYDVAARLLPSFLRRCCAAVRHVTLIGGLSSSLLDSDVTVHLTSTSTACRCRRERTRRCSVIRRADAELPNEGEAGVRPCKEHHRKRRPPDCRRDCLERGREHLEHLITAPRQRPGCAAAAAPPLDLESSVELVPRRGSSVPGASCCVVTFAHLLASSQPGPRLVRREQHRQHDQPHALSRGARAHGGVGARPRRCRVGPSQGSLEEES
jgi:hypothetical protein